MTQVLVRSALPLSIVRDGAEVLVEETDDVKTMIADGKLIVISRYPDEDPAPAADGIVGQRQDGWRVTDAERGEYDATHGEAGPLTDPSRFDPEPGDPDFDEYDSKFDAELPAPKAGKARRGD